MDIGLGAIIFLIWMVISVANGLKKQAEANRAKRMAPKSKPDEMSEDARRTIYGEGTEAVREARPKGARPRAQRPAAPAQELLETLFGVQTTRTDTADTEEVGEEVEWTSVAPAPRPEMPQRQQQRRRQRPERPPVRRREVVPHSHDRPVLHSAQSRLTSEHEQREARKLEERRRAEAEAHQREQQLKKQREAQEVARQRKAAQVRRTAATAATPRGRRGRLFEGAHEVRKAIVFAEILGPPKALEDL